MTSASATTRRSRFAAGAIAALAALCAGAPAAEATRGVTVLGGYTVPQAPVVGDPAVEGPWGTAYKEYGRTTAAVGLYEKSPGSTIDDPAATRACVTVERWTTTSTKKGSTTSWDSHSGCGALSVHGLGTSSVAISGSVEPGLTVNIRAVATGLGVRHPVTFCGWPFAIPCPRDRAGVFRWARHEGTITSSKLGTFDVKALGGRTQIWDAVALFG